MTNTNDSPGENFALTDEEARADGRMGFSYKPPAPRTLTPEQEAAIKGLYSFATAQAAKGNQSAMRALIAYDYAFGLAGLTEKE